LHYYSQHETRDRATNIVYHSRLFDRHGKKRFSAEGSL